MTKKNYLSQYKKQYGKDIVFEFKGSDFIYVLIGYPIWKAYIVSLLITSSLEVTSTINFKKKSIEIPERKRKNKTPQNHSDYFTKAELEKISNFFKLIPQDIIDLVKKYPDSHWEFVKAIISLGKNFETLIDTNPAIAYISVNLNKFNPTFSIYIDKHFYMEDIILRKQKKILELARFEATEQIVKIISKFEYKLLTCKNLELMRAFLQSRIPEKRKILRLLSHQKTIGEKHFDILFKNSKLLNLLSFKAINELLDLENYNNKISVLKSIKKHIANLTVQLPLIKSATTIESVLATVKKAETKRKEEENKFPPPPISGNEYITPLKTKRDLAYWAKKQINCIYGYEKMIKKNRDYFYKVVYGNEEASLQLRLSKNKIAIKELLGKRNKKVSRELRRIVEQWLNENEN